MKRTLAALAATVAVLVGLAPAAAAQEDTRVVLRPGDGITFSSQDASETGWCSISALGRDNADRLIALTAGHCVAKLAPGAPVYKVGEQGAGVLGNTTPVFSGGSMDWLGVFVTNDKPDYAALLIDESKARGSNTSLTDAEGESVAITGTRTWTSTGSQNIGSVCAIGHTSKMKCADPYLGVKVRSNLINSFPANSPGDSGGTLVTADGELLGIIVGRTFDFPRDAATRIDVVVNDMTAKGSYGAGWVPLTTP